MEPEYIQTIILRSNPGMVRDCWFEESSGQAIFCIRQTKFDSSGGAAESKIVRLVGDEWRLVRDLLRQKAETKLG